MKITLTAHEKSIAAQLNYLFDKFKNSRNVYWLEEICTLVKGIANNGKIGISILANLAYDHRYLRHLFKIQKLKPYWKKQIKDIGNILGYKHQFEIPAKQHPFDFICGIFFASGDINEVTLKAGESFGNISVYALILTQEFVKLETETNADNCVTILKKILMLANRAVDDYAAAGLLLRSIIYYDLRNFHFKNSKNTDLFPLAIQDAIQAKILRHRFNTDWNNAFKVIDSNIYRTLNNFPRTRTFKLFKTGSKDPLQSYINNLETSWPGNIRELFRLTLFQPKPQQTQFSKTYLTEKTSKKKPDTSHQSH